MRKIYPPNDVEEEIQALHDSVATELEQAGSSEKISIIKLLKTRAGVVEMSGLNRTNHWRMSFGLAESEC